jgi:hypothetical protein
VGQLPKNGRNSQGTSSLNALYTRHLKEESMALAIGHVSQTTAECGHLHIKTGKNMKGCVKMLGYMENVKKCKKSEINH